MINFSPIETLATFTSSEVQSGDSQGTFNRSLMLYPPVVSPAVN